MQLLVAGSTQVDAGKTTFSVGLLDHVGGTGFKPRAGNDYWFDHDDYCHATTAGRLYGKDARRLAAVNDDRSPETINPIHRLWQPSPGPNEGLLGRTDREFVVDRVGWDDPTYVVNDTVELPASITTQLPLNSAIRVASLEEFNEVMRRVHLPALERIGDRIEATDRSVIESYGAIARPITTLEPDAVAVVEPGIVRIYDGARYAKACTVASGSAREGRLEVPVDRVVDLIERQATVELPALDSETQAKPERIANAYAPAYDALCTTARET
ncbi:ATPase [Halocatena salina]|uniref:ATPase n=1 Tax=Halocatena salina TaxID=2934340 RepID=A0A8U0A4X9_9EURY|nr:ATPase [Halocatena salina]UPM44142.1 ATPase [Halocatena salina]